MDVMLLSISIGTTTYSASRVQCACDNGVCTPTQALMCKQGFFAAAALQPCVQDAVDDLERMWTQFQHAGRDSADAMDTWLTCWDARVSECRQAVSMVRVCL